MESGTGTVRFRAVVDATPHGAVKRRQVTRTMPSLAEARAFVAEVRAQVEQGREVERQTSTTVEQLCERWLTSRVDVRAVTVESYRYAMKPALRIIGNRQPDTITRADVQRMIATLRSAAANRPRFTPRASRSVLARCG